MGSDGLAVSFVGLSVVVSSASVTPPSRRAAGFLAEEPQLGFRAHCARGGIETQPRALAGLQPLVSFLGEFVAQLIQQRPGFVEQAQRFSDAPVGVAGKRIIVTSSPVWLSNARGSPS